MSFSRTLLSVFLATGIILPAAAHEITFAVGGLSSTLNSEFKVSEADEPSFHDSGTHTQLGGEAALGYVWDINSGFNIGFELFYDYVPDLQIEDISEIKNTINAVWGGRVLPGFQVTDNTKIYIDLGYAVIDQEVSIGENVAGISGFSETSATNKFGGGFQYGAGVETMMYKTLGIRLAYTVQQASEVSLKNDADTISIDATPTIFDFFFGFTYHFQF